ncbi:MAG: D-tyrosyl-tRNA(Tyr) deacylase [Candidatus Schekmanbacteria bacterium]|nr:D-tyrosyl-tRNA(Tyr) deacylase [Candidatus Schekmanbacteria bacterium]
MLAVVQRVESASVRIDRAEVGAIGPGLVVLLGVAIGDGLDEARFVANKVAELRIFNDEAGKMNRSLLDTGYQALVVSQFTLLGDTRRGRRPGFDAAARPDCAEPLYEAFVQELRARGIGTETGRFGASMKVELVNDGPVTLLVGDRSWRYPGKATSPV